MQVRVLRDGSAGRVGTVIRRYERDGERWYTVRLDSRTVANGPVSHFEEVLESQNDDEPID